LNKKHMMNPNMNLNAGDDDRQENDNERRRGSVTSGHLIYDMEAF
jgi:hypothetical protein